MEPFANRRSSAPKPSDGALKSRITSALHTATDGRGADVLFECTGVAKLLQPSAELVRRGGTLSLVGYTAELSSVSYGDWVSRELRVVASLVYTHEDFLGAMLALWSGKR